MADNVIQFPIQPANDNAVDPDHDPAISADTFLALAIIDVLTAHQKEIVFARVKGFDDAFKTPASGCALLLANMAIKREIAA